MLKGIFIAFFCFILFFTTHVIVFHNFNVRRRFRTLFSMWIGLFPIYIVMFVLIPKDAFLPIIVLFGSLKAIGFLYGVIIYVIFVFFYIHLIIFVDRSVSTRIMMDIDNSANRKLSLEQIKQIYNLDGKIAYELEDMKYIGYISEDSRYFKNTVEGSRYARFAEFLKNYLNLGLR